jgi:hypothetical protein
VTAYDDTSFELLKGNDQKVEVKWSELDAVNLYGVRSLLIGKTDGQAWLSLGRDLRGMTGGEKLAERAFANALKADPKLKDAVAAARKEVVKPAALESGKSPSTTTPSTKPQDDSDDASPAPNAPGGPRMIGQAPKGAWKTLTPEEQVQAVKELQAFADETQKKMSIQLIPHETNFFLFYSDLSPTESKKWADLLDRMYARLSELFATGKGVNVWRGKALVFVFSKSEDYLRFQRLMHNTDAGGSAGMCHSFGNGDVHIAFYRQPDEKTFAHVLVHESVHGFLHRFKTPVPIPSWINEGLAETIATELVPRASRGNDVLASAKAGMQGHGNSLGGMLEAKPITGWQYPVAESLTEFMIQNNKVGYVNFVIGIKEGMPWEEALPKKFKANRENLVRVYGETMKIKELKE